MTSIRKYIILKDAREALRDRQTRIKAMGYTGLIAALLLFLAIWFHLPPMDPPLPEAPATMLVDLTNVDFTPAPVNQQYVKEHSGGSESAKGNQKSAPNETKTVAEGSQNTDNKDKSNSAEQSGASGDLEKDKDVPPTHQRTTPSENTSSNLNGDPDKDKATKAETPTRKVDPKNLFKKGNSGTAKEGTSHGTGGFTPGQQGTPNGTNSDKFGTGGTTSGTGTGIGDGWELGGRSKRELPQPDVDVQRNGKVIVEIKVDRKGKVIGVRGGIKGSDITDVNIVAACEKAAMKATFTPNEEAPETQYGKIIYKLKVR